MTTRFNQCPNCFKRPTGGFWGGTHMTIHECHACGTLYCYKCGDKRCPNCGGKMRKDAGVCLANR